MTALGSLRGEPKRKVLYFLVSVLVSLTLFSAMSSIRSGDFSWGGVFGGAVVLAPLAFLMIVISGLALLPLLLVAVRLKLISEGVAIFCFFVLVPLAIWCLVGHFIMNGNYDLVSLAFMLLSGLGSFIFILIVNALAVPGSARISGDMDSI